MTTIYFSAKQYYCRFNRQNFIHPFAFFLFFFTLGIHSLVAQTYPAGFSQVQVAGGISEPTVMAFAPDGRIFVAEQAGRLRVIKNGALLPTPFVQLSVNSSGERGLIGIALDPDFETNNYIYLYYTVPSSPIHNRISRFTANGDVVLAGSETIILELDNLSGATNHNGGAMKFGPDGKLYVAVGENANPNRAQNLDTYHGKLLRINADGSVPSDNPFSGGSQQRQRVWSYGLRNPFTFDIEPGTGKIFVNDVGQSTWEEINDATNSGLNFGWPLEEGPSTDPAFTNPVYAYGRGSSDGVGCAITGGTFFNPATSSYPSTFTGNYFFLDYCSNWINVLDFSDSTAVHSSFATNINGSAVSLSVGNDGNLYYLSRDSDALFKIIYTNNNLPVITSQPISATITQGQSVSFSVSASGMQPLSYQWQKNGSDIAGATAATFSIANVQPSGTGQYRAIVSNPAGSATSDAATLTVSTFNAAPTAIITSPANQTVYQAGTVISFSGTGSDPEDGTLPDSAYVWTVIFHHDTHTHPGPAVTVAPDGQSGSFEIPAEGHLEANVWYTLQLTVTDSQGLSTTTYVDLVPQVVTLSFNSNPAGLTVNIDGQPKTTPYSFQTVAGVLISLSTPSPQTLNGTSYTFSNWENGLGTGGTITVPTADTTYTANFTANNLGFENDFTSWFTYGTASINTADVRSGSKSGYFSDGGGNYVITGLTPGATYAVKAWVKAVSGTDIWIVVSSYGGVQTGANMTSTSWTQSDDIVFTMGANNTSATLAAWTGPTSAAYFDDYTIVTCSNCRTSAEAESRWQSEALTLKVHPNPANLKVTLDLSGFAEESAVQVRMTDMTGKLFVGQQVQIGEGIKQVTLPVSHLPQGLFFVTVQGSKTTKTAKLVITR